MALIIPMSDLAYPIVLSIAGSDSAGGAGIQGDIKTISALGCFATTAVTAVTVQNTVAVSGIHEVPPNLVTTQIEAVMTDMKPLAVKIGMIYSAALAEAIAHSIRKLKGIPIVLDPVMVASSGQSLTTPETIGVIKSKLLPLIYLVTPNLSEASILSEMTVETLDDMKQAARKILAYGSFAVLIKGGHLKGNDLYDVYLDRFGVMEVFNSEHIQTNNTHGTGCCLSSAIASYLALGETLTTAISKAKIYLHQALIHGKDVKTGNGKGPLNHFFQPNNLIKRPIK
jgi:hydroxymethylpyrimidine/phosphomethylpyrimidine kinase